MNNSEEMAKSEIYIEKRKLYEDLCRLYETGCSHDEAFAAVGAVSHAQAKLVESVVLSFGHEDGLPGLRDFCLRRSRARLKSCIFAAAEEAKDAQKILVALQAIDHISYSGELSAEAAVGGKKYDDDLVKEAMRVLGVDKKSFADSQSQPPVPKRQMRNSRSGGGAE